MNVTIWILTWIVKHLSRSDATLHSADEPLRQEPTGRTQSVATTFRYF
ncbi:hypothetical protein [Chitinimonas lacunae]|uniref:Uncharacterized protein n=1 Tax=Chitinimonas lacunae TaxID=1963018 RepID=A0ABV8MM54_9NEIS